LFESLTRKKRLVERDGQNGVVRRITTIKDRPEASSGARIDDLDQMLHTIAREGDDGLVLADPQDAGELMRLISGEANRLIFDGRRLNEETVMMAPATGAHARMS
jgi:hypothetical protein